MEELNVFVDSLVPLVYIYAQHHMYKACNRNFCQVAFNMHIFHASTCGNFHLIKIMELWFITVLQFQTAVYFYLTFRLVIVYSCFCNKIRRKTA